MSNILPLGVAVSEGFCPNGHGRLTPVRLHGNAAAACLTCECSWRISNGTVLASACIPGDHTCGGAE